MSEIGSESSMIITLVAASGPRPVGGAMSTYDLANALSLQGHDVHLVHRDLAGERVESVGELSWATFEPAIHHHFPRVFDATSLPDADFVFHCDESLPERSGLPLIFVRGAGVGRPVQEQRMLAAPCPLICISSWLVNLGRRIGIPEQRLVYVREGVRHEKYKVVMPIENRPPQVSMLYHNHRFKGSAFGLRALEIAKQEIPGLSAVLFGAQVPKRRIPNWVEYRKLPPQQMLVEEIYNRSRVFVSPSIQEGFGRTALEAMACGCALVTTDNGGSAEYAVPGETALVAPPMDAEALAEGVVTLLLDSERQAKMAKQAREHALSFTWARTADRLEAFLMEYGADPARYQSRAVSGP